MKRMNKLSAEVGKRHEGNKESRLKGERDHRTSQVLLCFCVILAIVLFSFGLNYFKFEEEEVDDNGKKIFKSKVNIDDDG